MPIELDSRGNLILGPVTSQPNSARIRVAFDADDTKGVGLQIDACPVGASERAAIQIGDFLLAQDSAQSGTKDLVILDANGYTVNRFSNASVPFSTSYGAKTFRIHSAIPFILPGTFTANDDGALELGTALPTTYSGCWMWFDTGQLYVASEAGFYWVVMSSTTEGTVYNSTYTAGTIPAIGTATAFDAYTGAGAGQVGVTDETLMAEITFPAASLALGHKLRISALWAVEDTADVKTARIRWSGIAGTALVASTLTDQTGGLSEAEVWNRAVANEQVISGRSVYDDDTVEQAAAAYDTIDTSVQTTVVFTAEKAAETNNAVLEAFTIVIDQ